MGKFIKYKKPDFLLCEIPIKDKSFNDDRIWVYSTQSLSLIEFINVDSLKDFSFNNYQERFEYSNSTSIENWFGVFTQNNCEITDNSESEIMQNAWAFLKNYFDWENKNIDNTDKNKWN